MAKELHITSDKLAHLLEVTADMLRQEVERNQELDKLARALAIIEPLQSKGLLSKMVGKSISEKTHELAKMADRDFQMLEYMAQKGPQAYQGFGKSAKEAKPSSDQQYDVVVQDLDQLVMGR